MRRLADALISPLFWEVRLASAAVSVLIVWSSVIMTTEVIAYTPVEYLPTLVVIGLLVTVFFVILKGKTAYNDSVKKKLRSGEISEAPAYGMDYLASNVGCVIVGVVGAFLIPGLIYHAVGAAPEFSGCIVMALVWSFVVGVKGVKSLSEAVDLFRDPAKISELEAAAKSEKKTE